MAFGPIVPTTKQSPFQQRSDRISFLQRTQSNDNEEDWRNFRAKLVMQYRKQESGLIPTRNNIDGTSANNAWAYESGYTIEKGSIVLSRHSDEAEKNDPESGLAQQYFHKSIILVLGKIAR
jgi:hypothetical protein